MNKIIERLEEYQKQPIDNRTLLLLQDFCINDIDFKQNNIIVHVPKDCNSIKDSYKNKERENKALLVELYYPLRMLRCEIELFVNENKMLTGDISLHFYQDNRAGEMKTLINTCHLNALKDFLEVGLRKISERPRDKRKRSGYGGGRLSL